MSEEDLLAAIAADVDAIEPRLVYADWAQAQGDPRGELAIIEHRLAAQPELRPRWQELTTQARQALLLPGMQPEVIRRWYLGFVDELRFTRRAVHLVRRSKPAWFERPALRFVRRLNQAIIDPRAWYLIAAWPYREYVRALEHGSTQQPLAALTFDAIATHLPQLRELELRAFRMPPLERLARLPLHHLGLELAGFDGDALEALATVPWKLTSLAVRGIPRDVTFAMLEPILAASQLAGLRHLELYGLGISALAVVERLVETGALARLESLTLNWIGIDDSVRPQLARHRDALAHVRLGMLAAVDAHRQAIAQNWFGVLLEETLGRHADAVAAFESGILQTHDRRTLRAYAAATRGLGAPARMHVLVDRVLRSFHHSPPPQFATALKQVSVELLASGPIAEFTLHSARASLTVAKGAEALATLAAEPATDTTRLLRALGHQLAGDPAAAATHVAELVATTECPAYRALAWLAGGDWPIPPSCIEPADVLAAVGLASDHPEDALDCAEIAAIRAICDGDRPLARARIAALVAALPAAPRPWHFDLMVAGAVVAERGSHTSWIVRTLQFAVRGSTPQDIVAIANRDLEDQL